MKTSEIENIFNSRPDDNYSFKKWLDLETVSSIVLENNISLYPSADNKNNVKTQYYFDDTHELLYTRFAKCTDGDVLTSVNEAIDFHTIISIVFVSDINIKNPPKFGASV